MDERSKDGQAAYAAKWTPELIAALHQARNAMSEMYWRTSPDYAHEDAGVRALGDAISAVDSVLTRANALDAPSFTHHKVRP